MAWNQDFGEGANPGSGYEQQSWRDSYNGGRAAGDWTGNHNERLDAEREAFQGATWTGSSTQYSALEVARLRGSAPEVASTAVAQVMSGGANGGGSAALASPARQSVAAALMVGGGAFGDAQANKPQSLAFAGFDMRANPFYSNAGDGEERWGEIGGEFVGLMAMGADIGSNAARMYFGENYRQLGPQQRISIIGERTQSAAKDGIEGAIGALFAGFDAVEQWGVDNRKAELARHAAQKEVDDAWGARLFYQEQESRKAGDFGFVGSYLQ